MKVYNIEPHRECYGGAILIAANSEEEAKNLYFGENLFNETLYLDARCSITEIPYLFYEGDDKDFIILNNLHCNW